MGRRLAEERERERERDERAREREGEREGERALSKEVRAASTHSSPLLPF
jgi:hypothetical protein